MSQPVNRTRVAHVITDLSTGGAEIMLYRLVSKMEGSRYTNLVISLTGKGPVGARIEELGIPVRCLDMKPGVLDIKSLFRLAGWLKDFAPEIIQTWMYHSDLIGGLAGRLGQPRAKVVWGIHNSTLDPATSKHSTMWVVRLLALLSHIIPDRILSCSIKAREVHVHKGYAARKFQVIPNGFDLGMFQPDTHAKDEIRQELNISEGVPLVGLIARFDPQKDHATFLKAGALLARRIPTVHFLLCGDRITQENQELNALVESTGLQERVHLLGRREDMPRVMAALDVAATSSAYGEAFPQVVGEAMACGILCVVTDVGDSAYMVGETGKVVPPLDPDALASALAELLEVPNEERVRMGRAARERIKKNFSLPSVVQQYDQVYSRLVQGFGKLH
jgi:glycosyltransferase involved in cell wall biosynthesis